MLEEKKFYSIPIENIHIDENFNCRGKIAPIDVMELAQDLEKQGQISPVIVTPYNDKQKAETGKGYLLIAGYRRTTAALVAGWTMIDAIIKEDVTENQARYLNLRENIQRKDLNAVQEALALKPLHDRGITRQDIAQEIGMSSGWVQVRLMVLDLPAEVQEQLAAGFINLTQVRDLYTVIGREGKEACYALARKMKDNKVKGGKAIETNPSRTNPNAKKVRKRPEMFTMMDHIQENLGNGLYTRALSWCAGEISNLDLYQSIKEEAINQGKEYTAPEEAR